MNLKTLDILRCPFCGGRLALVEESVLTREGDAIESGVLGCQCCAFPIIAGIPVLIADDATRAAMHQLEAGHGEAALFALLGLAGQRADAFSDLRRRGGGTYRDSIELLSPDPEGTYFLYRFSDPTFLVAQAVLRALGSHPRVGHRALDLCGGTGHMTRILTAFTPPGQTVLADLFFWKLWLAKRFTAPACEPICCDANSPLPFSRDSFSLAVLADAFPYIWHKRLLADEMMRAVGQDGVIVMNHLHSALGENYAAGNPLTPEGYRELFAPATPRFFKDSQMLDQLLDRNLLDLRHHTPPNKCGSEPAVTLIASRRDDVFREYELDELLALPEGTVVVNPLYQVDVRDGKSVLSLTFPTPEYEEEYGACARYLPKTIVVMGDLSKPLDPKSLGAQYETLKAQLVVFDAPHRYC